MHISFHGACRQVTGSNILVETSGAKILLDCGFFQGTKFAEEQNYAPFAYDPETIDFVIICHAHLDHTGRLPKLVKDGFRGKIYATAPTAELTKLVLEDSVKLMFEESKHQHHQPLYTLQDIETTINLFTSISYNQPLEIAPGIKIALLNAGHILGSAIVTIESENKKLVYTSDLGNVPSELLNPPQTIDQADIAVIETTYGNRIHETASRRQQKLNTVVKNTIAESGVLMIPSFAIERTQELLHDLEDFCTANNCALPTFFLDSPLAERVTRVFEKYPEYLNPKLEKAHLGNIFGLERLKITTTREQFQEIDQAPNPKIIIAGSGMLNGGRILYHLQKYIEDPKNTLLIVGWQQAGTLGRKLLEGASTIKIFGKKYTVRAQILAIGSYSAHADASQLLNWLSKINGLDQIFLVHGEIDNMMGFAQMINQKLARKSLMPQENESYEL